ncbi:uncharacterized protein (TIGR02680 family) [Streptacidiphilus sp. MAP12-20]|uniref:TIGR02680 family protein n=1 Tax=Streptacidiphilus sp. MAP12-20 TaxID=3156299 RepID=UPI0035176C9C
MGVTLLPNHSTDPSAGAAIRSRWQPSRAGILNVWRYYDEIFTFHRGRLLLRGPNGTGKSKALEVLLPFLLDASLRPNRLSTFGGSERTMHWNLMGEGTSGKTRVGYVWLEFTRNVGREQFWFTCGARLQASLHTSGVQTDYFTTTHRVDHPDGLSLVNDSGQPLTRAALAEAIRGSGTVHDTASDYRHEVRATLFPGLTEQGYDALITALLQLRTPKLSERLDPSLLSSLLSRALPPLGQHEIAELAEGFERLDRQREHLRALDAEVAAATTVAAQQRGYAQRVLRAGAASLISATTDMDNRTRDARTSKDQLDQAVAERSRITDGRTAHRNSEAETHGTIEGLEASEPYRQGQQLTELRVLAERARREASRLGEQAQRQVRTADRERTLAEDLARQEAEHEARVLIAFTDAQTTAHRAALESVFDEIRTSIDATANSSEATAGACGDARRLARGAVSSRRHQIGQVRSAIESCDRAVAGRTVAESQLESARGRLTVALSDRDQKQRAFGSSLERLAEALHQWSADCSELLFEDAEQPAFLAADADQVLDLVNQAALRADTAIIVEQASLRLLRETAESRRNELQARREHLGREIDLPPNAPHTRTADRSTLPGAPLWRLITFRDGTSPQLQAGIEAALEASGLLDAWMAPDGSIRLPGHDRHITITDVPALQGNTLAQVLEPEPESTVPASRVAELLTRVAYGAVLPTGQQAAIGSDGSWRLSVTSGTWAKTEARYIGAAARKRARKREIETLTGELVRAEQSLADLDQQAAALDSRRARLEADLAARPSRHEVEQAEASANTAEAAVVTREDSVREAVSALDTTEKAVATALRALTRLSAEHSLPTERAALDKLEGVLESLRDHIDHWLETRLHGASLSERLTTARDRAEAARDEAVERSGEAEEAETEALACEAKLRAVEGAVGEDYRQIAARIAALRVDLTRTRNAIEAAGKTLLEIEGSIGRLRSDVAHDEELRDQARDVRDKSALRLRRLCLLNLPQDAGITVALGTGDGIRTTQEAARVIATAWPGLLHEPRHVGDALTRLLTAVHEARARFGGRVDLDVDQDDEVHVLAATMNGIRMGAAGLLSALTEERDRSRDDITTAERELFDRTLTGGTRRHLASRIRQAGELVERMNAHLTQVRTASDVAVRLVWQIHPDLPTGTRTARELLLKDPARITEADREALHAFFRGRIEDAKARNTAASWEEQLGQVLDYTSWHQFVVKLDRAKGAGWQLLTKKLHGALSGGEKAIALHLPLFAAVAAHYEAVPESPRLILLDEVFVGVDTVNRGQVFALLTALDLDMVLTSDHEWCTYRELPGIAIHQLITGSDGDDAVTSARFTWTGLELQSDEPEEALL